MTTPFLGETKNRKQAPGPCQVAFGSYVEVAVLAAATGKQQCCAVVVDDLIIPDTGGGVKKKGFTAEKSAFSSYRGYRKHDQYDE